MTLKQKVVRYNDPQYASVEKESLSGGHFVAGFSIYAVELREQKTGHNRGATATGIWAGEQTRIAIEYTTCGTDASLTAWSPHF
ncbi:MAG: hypothetical protein ACE5IY_20300 [bacterium]